MCLSAEEAEDPVLVFREQIPSIKLSLQFRWFIFTACDLLKKPLDAISCIPWNPGVVYVEEASTS